MNKDLLLKHIKASIAKHKADPFSCVVDLKEREERVAYYSSWTAERLQKMTVDEFSEYLSKLWAMRSWGNKQYVADKLIADNGLTELLKSLSDCIWGEAPLPQRWDKFREGVKGMGPAMISELLCYTHTDECVLWNRRAYIALNYLGVKNLPRHNYQLTGKKYEELCRLAEEIAQEMRKEGVNRVNLLTVDYFVWDELQVEEKLSNAFKPSALEKTLPAVDDVKPGKADFIHNEVRDAISDIGGWLGFKTSTEKKVADGAIVDAVWEATIGNMGRVIYVFEVQTKGSVDSLMVNLIRAQKNPAVQGIVAVSDAAQIEKIKKEAATMPSLKDNLKYWDCAKILEVHEALELVNESINSLDLVPQGF